MSHEIRTPMNAILGMGKMSIDNLSDTPFVQDCLEKLMISSKYLLGLLNDILDMTKIESEKMVLADDVFNCTQMLNNVNQMIESQASLSGVNYIYKKHHAVQNYYRGDEKRLQQILINLLNNAVKFTPSGGKVYLAVEQIQKDDNMATLQFIVADTGIGISEKFISHLFDAFTQEHDGSTMTYGGSGLGLSIAYKFAHLMDGDIAVQSKVNVGTTFTATVRLKQCSENVDGINNEEDIIIDEKIFQGKNILLIEDHPLNIIVAQKMLSSKGCHVVVAENGKMGLDAFLKSNEGEFDAIFMDIRMPVMDGLTCARKIRALVRSDAKKVPIIAMTANAFKEDVDKSIRAGMNGHLAKPIEEDTLFHTLYRLLLKNS